MRTGVVRAGVVAVLVGLTAFTFGCGAGGTGGANKGKEKDKAKATEVADAGKAAKKEHVSEGWWCDEHGIPEDECSMCDKKVAKAFKDKGDWCKEHDRAKSQCFKCDPSLKEKFAAKYRAKYNAEPPPIGEEEDAKKK